MSNSTLERRLTPMDAFFVYADTETAPMNVGATLIFEGKLPYAKFKQHIASRLHLMPRYRQRVVPVPFNLSHPTWEDDPDFNIDNHIFHVKLEKPGTEEQLQELKGRIFTGMLDREKPLWEMHVVEGLSGGRSAMIMKVHHCMVDGVAGIGLAFLFLDVTPSTPPKVKKPQFRPAPLPDARKRLWDGIWDNTLDNVKHWMHFTGNVKEFAQRFEGADLGRAFGKFTLTLGNFLLPLTRMPFNRTFSGERVHTWREYAYADVRAIRAICGGTLNDVVLAALGQAFRKYMESQPNGKRGKRAKHRSMRVLVPVNVRREEEQGAFGNRISFLPVEVPMNIKDPMELARAVHERMRELKDAHVADSINLMFDALQGMPVAFQASALATLANPAAQRLLGSAVDVPPANLICTNVPGPQVPLYALGHKLLAMYAVVPTCLGMGVNCAVVSYDQKLFVSFSGDALAAGDAVEKTMEYFDQKFHELRKAAEVAGAKYAEITRPIHRDEQPVQQPEHPGTPPATNRHMPHPPTHHPPQPHATAL